MIGIASWDPPVDRGVLDALVTRISRAGVRVARDHILGPLTTFGLGGPAGAYVIAEDLGELHSVLGSYESIESLDAAPMLVLGKGSNTLISDAGFAGLVLKLGSGFKGYSRVGDVVEAGAAEAMPALATWVAQEGLAGLEFAAAIPATVGGSVRMNAGAHGGEMGSALVSIDVASVAGASVTTVAARDLGLGYRHSQLPRGSVVIKARWQLTPDVPMAVMARLDELRAYRRATQPLRDRTCGSVFTNPDGDSAGRLIDSAGLRGLTIGGASVSTKHANFIAAAKHARSQDVLDLIRAVQLRVVNSGGPLLMPEVQLVGHFDD